ncbi:MAG: Rieske 2Fe-2S domain-containing protein [Micromonosporaceae bacterium]|nr:Rieske 2Fe-2S domain-containing protein [Micromonosporaceae bacterium]
MEIPLGPAEDLRRDGCRIVAVDGRSVGVISVGEEFFAIHDRCPHMGASMCAGSVSGTLLPSAPTELVYGLDGLVIRCPWHGWEFDLRTGRALLEPERVGLRTYQVVQVGDEVVLRT